MGISWWIILIHFSYNFQNFYCIHYNKTSWNNLSFHSEEVENSLQTVHYKKSEIYYPGKEGGFSNIYIYL
jgi:hypothetical protein